MNSIHPSITQVAVGIVHNSENHLLFAQRPAGKPYAGWWEFPGGKIEADETVELALARELREELGIQILDCQPWLTQRFVYPHAHVNLQFCHVRTFSGRPQSLEGQAFAWGTARHPPLPFLPAALPVLKALQLPDTLRITAAAELGVEVWHSQLQRLAAGLVIVDEPNLNEIAAQAVFTACLAWQSLAPMHRTVLVASHHPAAWRGLANGVVLSATDVAFCRQRPSHAWVMAQVNSRESIESAAVLGVNAVLVDANAGWGALGDTLQGAQVASYVLGDWATSQAPMAHAAGALGLAVKQGGWLNVN